MTIDKKYKLVKDTRASVFNYYSNTHFGVYNIKALRDIGDNIKKGQIGGLVESEANLSQDGTCWIHENATVRGHASVRNDAQVKGYARISDKAWIINNAIVSGSATVSGSAIISDDAMILGCAMIGGNASISKKVIIQDYARILTGHISEDYTSTSFQLAKQLGVIPSSKDGNVTLYKKVNKLSKGKYKSLYDSAFRYQDNRIAKVKDYDSSSESCAKGIHLSTPFYWEDGDTLIACEVNIKDIITVQEGKVRCKKCKVLGEVKF